MADGRTFSLIQHSVHENPSKVIKFCVCVCVVLDCVLFAYLSISMCAAYNACPILFIEIILQFLCAFFRFARKKMYPKSFLFDVFDWDFSFTLLRLPFPISLYCFLFFSFFSLFAFLSAIFLFFCKTQSLSLFAIFSPSKLDAFDVWTAAAVHKRPLLLILILRVREKFGFTAFLATLLTKTSFTSWRMNRNRRCTENTFHCCCWCLSTFFFSRSVCVCYFSVSIH